MLTGQYSPCVKAYDYYQKRKQLLQILFLMWMLPSKFNKAIFQAQRIFVSRQKLKMLTKFSTLLFSAIMLIQLFINHCWSIV